MRRRQKKRPPDPRYPIHGLRILDPEPRPPVFDQDAIATSPEIRAVEAYRFNILTGEQIRLDADDPFVKVFDQVRPMLYRIK